MILKCQEIVPNTNEFLYHLQSLLFMIYWKLRQIQQVYYYYYYLILFLKQPM